MDSSSSELSSDPDALSERSASSSSLSSQQLLPPSDNVPSLKRFDIVGDHEFIRHGEFSILHYNLPVLPSTLTSLNTERISEETLGTVDLLYIFRKMADVIGDSIQGAFHLIPPNDVLKQISQKFLSEFPLVQGNFEKVKLLQSPSKLDKYNDIGKLLLASLNLWKVARSARLKRNPNAVWKYRNGSKQAELTKAYQERLDSAKKAKSERKAKRLSLQAKLTVSNEENAKLKLENAALLQELNELKNHQLSAETIEPFRLRDAPPNSGNKINVSLPSSSIVENETSVQGRTKQKQMRNSTSLTTTITERPKRTRSSKR